MQEARFYRKLRDKAVQCILCERKCVLKPGFAGFCKVRKNIEGKLYSLVYAKPVAISVDPVEKKPLYNFMPGTFCNSIATFGCNFACPYCQNFDISQEFSEADIELLKEVEPEQVVQDTIEKGAQGIAYTYVEPTVFAEYAIDIMKLAKKEKLYNVWVSNGYFTKALAKELAGYMHAINIDLKGDDAFYRRMCLVSDSKPVKRNIKYLHRKKVHVEVTNLLIPDENTSMQQISELASFIASVSKKIPLHFTRFFPSYKMLNKPITSLEELKLAYKIAKEKGLYYVYIGNIPGKQNTYCPKCGALLIERENYMITLVAVDENGRCKNCGYKTGIKMSF